MRRLLVVGLCCLLSVPGAAAGLELCLQGGAGYTVLDIPAVVGYANDYLEDWGEFHWRVAVQGWYRLDAKLALGLEFGMQEQYYYYFRIPYGSDWLYPSNTVTPFTVIALLEYRLSGALALQGGLGAWIYDGGTAMGIAAALVYSVPLGPKLSLPIGVRMDCIFDQDVVIPIALVTGLRFSL